MYNKVAKKNIKNAVLNLVLMTSHLLIIFNTSKHFS